jgi:hypothetical protein
MTSDFFKSFLQLVWECNKFTFPPHPFDACIIRFDEGVQLFGGYAIFPPRIIGGLDFDRPQGHHLRARQNSNVFALDRGVQPFAKVLLGVRDRKSRHMGY